MQCMIFGAMDSLYNSLKWYTSYNITMDSTNHPPQGYTTMSVPSTIEYGHWEKTERRDSRERNGRWNRTERGLK